MRPVNLLPENLRPRQRSGSSSKGAYAVLGVLGATLVALILYIVTANQITSREAETERLRAETQAAEARAGALAPFGAFQAMKEVRVASVTGLASVRFDWERMARELARLMPEGVWLTKLDATATGEQVSGSSSTSSGSTSSSSGSGSSGAAASGEEQEPRISLTGCAPTQETVAETMVRLRRLHGAHDVELTKSERPEQQSASTTSSGSTSGATGAADGCGEIGGRPNYEFEVSVKLAQPPDEAVDGKPVPPSLGGGA